MNSYTAPDIGTTGLHTGTFGIGTYHNGERAFPGLVLPNGDVVDVSSHYADTHAVFDDWTRAFERLSEVAVRRSGPMHRFDKLRILPPVKRPNLIGAGANYRSHVAQMMTNNKAYQHLREPGEDQQSFFNRNLARVEKRAREGTPFVWAGLHSSMAGARDPYQFPLLGEQNEYETELGLVIGHHRRYATLEQAQQMIAGYMVVNDLGTVDIFRRTDTQFEYDWIGKHQPTATVCGPFIVPAPFVRWDELRIVFKVNGEVRQDWPANDMIFPPAGLVAYCSERLNLQPGDIIMTGSPPGNGSHWGRFLQEGDILEGEIAGLGRHVNVCVKEKAPDHPLVYGLWKNPTP